MTAVVTTVDKIVPENLDECIKYAKAITAKICTSCGCMSIYPELQSDALVGMLDAIEKFDATKNVKFKHYVYIRVAGAVLDGMRGSFCGSRNAVAFKKRLDKAMDELRTSDSEKLAEGLGMTLTELNKQRDYIENSVVQVSFSDIVPEGSSEIALDACIPDYVRIQPSDTDRLLAKEIFAIAKKILTPQEQEIFFSIYKGDNNMVETGKRLGISGSRVSQVHPRIISKIKSVMDGVSIEEVNQAGKERSKTVAKRAATVIEAPTEEAH